MNKCHIKSCFYSPCLPGDRRETEENVDYSWRSNPTERRREERDCLLSGWWQWDGGADGWYHPRWGSCLKSVYLMLSYLITLLNDLFFVHRFSLRKWYCSLLESRSRADEIQARWEVLCCSRLHQTELGTVPFMLVWYTRHLTSIQVKQLSDNVNLNLLDKLVTLFTLCFFYRPPAGTSP